VLGIPPPVVTWYKNGQRLAVADHKNLRLRHEGRKLEFVSASVADAGIYECRASNEAGSDSISFDLRVYGTATFYFSP
jgi:Immunoglobulin I-set domain